MPVKKIISALLGIGISVLSFFAGILLLFFPERNILIPLLAVFYASIIAFLVLWNTRHKKSVYLLLSISALCVVSGIIIAKYSSYLRAIKTVSEQDYNLQRYTPFGEDNALVKPGFESAIQLNGDVPVLDGATALYPVYAAFVEAVYPRGEYHTHESPVFCNGTGDAYKNLLYGEADIIFCAEPSEAELKMFLDNNIKIKLVPIGQEAFVFFVNKENPVDNVSVENIRLIYSGEIKNWKELGGRNRGIRAFQRPENSGSQTMLNKIMGNTPIEKPPRENLSGGMGDIINQVAVYRNFSNAVGYSFLYFTTEMVKNGEIKILSIDDIYPSKETIRNGTYPFSGNFYAIYVEKDTKNEHIEPFVEWILSGQGQKIISETGYTPIKQEP